jgi:hypothetical protein
MSPSGSRGARLRRRAWGRARGRARTRRRSQCAGPRSGRRAAEAPAGRRGASHSQPHPLSEGPGGGDCGRTRSGRFPLPHRSFTGHRPMLTRTCVLGPISRPKRRPHAPTTSSAVGTSFPCDAPSFARDALSSRCDDPMPRGDPLFPRDHPSRARCSFAPSR